MNTISQYQQEVIVVAHNSREEMRDNIKQLQEEGWSGNTRRMITFPLDKEQEEKFQKSLPNLTIYPAEDALTLQNKPYIYLTNHERIVSRQHLFEEEEL